MRGARFKEFFSCLVKSMGKEKILSPTQNHTSVLDCMLLCISLSHRDSLQIWKAITRSMCDIHLAHCWDQNFQKHHVHKWNNRDHHGKFLARLWNWEEKFFSRHKGGKKKVWSDYRYMSSFQYDWNSHVVITQLYNGEVCYIVLNEGHMSVSSNHWFEKPFIKILREYNWHYPWRRLPHLSSKDG